MIEFVLGINKFGLALGMVATLLLSLCGVPLLIKTVRDGHCRGLSAGFISAWALGELLMLIYVVCYKPVDLILWANFGLNLGICIVLGLFKFKPRD